MPKNQSLSPIQQVQGRPTIVRGDEISSQAVYCDYILGEEWEERIAEFIESGVKIFHLRVANGSRIGADDFYDSAFWTDDNTFPESDAEHRWSLGNQAGFVLERCSDAQFFIKLMTAPPEAFTKKHPDDMQIDEDGETYRQPSLSSERYHNQLRKYLKILIGFCENQAWASHIVGYLGMPIGEGILPLNIAGKMFDRSPANRRAFRRWLQEKYDNPKGLEKAWGEPGLDFEAVEIPRDSEWLEKRRTARPSIGGELLEPDGLDTNCDVSNRGLFHWVEEKNAARERDYCRFMRDNYLNWLRTIYGTAKECFRELDVERVFGLDAIKQPQIGWQIQLSFDGIGDGQSFPNMFALTGSWDVGELLDDPAVETVWNPADYYARTTGFGYESEGLTDSFALRGKIAFVENDARTYVGAGIKDQGAFRTPQKMRAGLRRNTAMVASRGLHGYWCNVGSAYFHNPTIQDEIQQLTETVDRLHEHPYEETENAIAFVIDDTGPIYEDFTSGFQTLALIIQRVRGLAHCGVPYRIYLLSDLQKQDLPDYHTWFFPNLFRVTDQVQALLDRKVLRDGNVAIFGPATGITDGSHLSASGASKLLGVEMELLPRTTVRHVVVRHRGHPITAELPANLVYGDSMPYGPLLLPKVDALEESECHALGHANACWFTNHTGLFVRENGRGALDNGKGRERGPRDYAIIWSAALPLPADLLRAAARFAGSHIWCEENDIVYANRTMAAIHTAKEGERRLSLPRECQVTDAVTGQAFEDRPVSEIELKLRSPDTRIFMLE